MYILKYMLTTGGIAIYTFTANIGIKHIINCGKQYQSADTKVLNLHSSKYCKNIYCLLKKNINKITNISKEDGYVCNILQGISVFI